MSEITSRVGRDPQGHCLHLFMLSDTGNRLRRMTDSAPRPPRPVPGALLPPPPPPVLFPRAHLSSPQQGGRSLSLSGADTQTRRRTAATGSPRWNSGRHAACLALTAESCHLADVQPPHLHLDCRLSQALGRPECRPHRLPPRCRAGLEHLGPSALASPCLTPLKTKTNL